MFSPEEKSSVKCYKQRNSRIKVGRNKTYGNSLLSAQGEEAFCSLGFPLCFLLGDCPCSQVPSYPSKRGSGMIHDMMAGESCQDRTRLFSGDDSTIGPSDVYRSSQAHKTQGSKVYVHFLYWSIQVQTSWGRTILFCPIFQTADTSYLQ